MTNPTPHGQVPEALRHAAAIDHWARADNGLRGSELRAAAAELRRLHAYCQELEAQVIRDCMTHVQNPAENEHVAGDVSKNGVKTNTTTAQPVAQQGAGDGFFLLLPQRPKPEAPAGTAGLDWDAYSGAQMLAFGRDCSDAAIAALRTQQPAPAGATPAESVERIVHLRAYRERRIYVAGPMTGLPEYNFPLFNSTAERLRSEGWHVENPAEHGHVEGAGWADYLRWDISRIATCGAIYLRPGWSNSKGATLEVHIAGVLALEVLLADGAEAPAPQPPTAQAASSAVLKAIRKANMQLVRTGDNAFMLVPYKVATAQAAESVPAVGREQERIVFKDAHRHLELDEVPDAWGRPMFKHSHVEASWLGWIARAARSPAESVQEEADLPPLPDPDLRDVGTKPQDVKDFLNGYATEYARLALAARAPAESVGRDAPEAALSPQVHLTRNTLLWWRELASINPQDLVPRIDAVLAAKGGNK